MKKISKILLMILVLFPTMFLFSCKSKVVSIDLQGAKVEFVLNEDFDLGNDIVIKAVLKNKKTVEINLSDLTKTDDGKLQNEEISIDYSAYNKKQTGDFDIVVTYLKDTKVTYTYTVTVDALEFTQDDYTVSGYEGVYDGKYHSISVIQNIGATVRYSSEPDGTYKLTESPKYKKVGEYTVYYKIEKSGYQPPVEGSSVVKINKAELQIKPVDVEITYNQEFKNKGCEYTGFVSGESEQTYPTKGTAKYTTTYQKGNNIGNYDIEMSGFTFENYNVTYVKGVLTVNKAQGTIVATMNDIVYGEQFNPVVTDLVADSYNTKYKLKTSEEWTEGLPVLAGEYNVNFYTDSTNNYESASIVLDVTILKKELVVTPKTTTIKYNTEFTDAELNYVGFVLNDDSSVITSNPIFETDYTLGDNVGKYSIMVSGLESNNYIFLYNVGVLSVEQANNNLNVTIENVVYGTKLTPVIISNDSGSELSYKYKSTENNLYFNGLPKNVGEYEISIISKKTTNYVETTITRVVNITKKSLSVTPKKISIDYNTNYYFGGFNYDGFVNENGYYDDESLFSGINFEIDSIDYTKGDNAGLYYVTYKSFEANNYNIIMNQGEIQVNKINLSVNDLIIPDTQYGDKFTISNLESIDNADITCEYKGMSYNDWTTEEPKQVGHYIIKVTISESINYYGYEKEFESNILQRKLIVTPKVTYIIYGDNSQEINYAGVDFSNEIYGKSAFAYDEDASSLSGQIDYSTNYVTGDNVGDYKINIKGLSSSNYDIVYNQGTLMVNRAENVLAISLSEITYGDEINPDVQTNLSGGELFFEYQKENSEEWKDHTDTIGTYNVRVSCLDTLNYKGISQMKLNDKLVINPRNLYVSPKLVEVPYNTLVEFKGYDDASITGFAYNETYRVLSGNLSVITDFVNGNDVGEYITKYAETLSATNYNIVYPESKIIIYKAENQLSIQLSENNTYGNNIKIIHTENISGGNITSFYKLSEETNYVEGMPLNAGNYDIKFVSAATKNYLMKEIIINNVIILPAKLKVESTKQYTISYNEEFNFETDCVEYTGFVNSETLDNFNGTIAYNTSYVKGDNVGIYYFTMSGLVNPNYTVEYIQGVINVIRAKNNVIATIDDVTYGQDLTPVITGTDINNNEAIIVEYKLSSENEWSIVMPKNAGSYDIRVNQAESQNFEGYLETFYDIKINPKELSVNWITTEFTYDGNLHRPTLVINSDSIIDGDKVAVNGIDEIDDDTNIIIYISDANVNAKNYTIEILNISNANYICTNNRSAEYVINKATIVVPENPESTYYNGNKQKPIIEEDSRYVIEYSEDNQTYLSAGKYVIQLTIIDPNYKWENLDNDVAPLTYTILKATDNEITTANISSFDFNSNTEVSAESKYGNVVVDYAPYQTEDYSQTMPVNAGKYTARFMIKETEDYNGDVEFVDFNIYKINPTYISPDKLVSAYNHNIKDIILPDIGDGLLTWVDNNYIFTSDDADEVEIIKSAIYTPNDTTNYNVVELNITLHIVDTRNVDFEYDKIVVNDFETEYTGADIEFPITLGGNSVGASIYYKLSIDDEYIQGTPSFKDVGEFTINIMLKKIDEVTYEYNNVVYKFAREYNDYIINKDISVNILDYVSLVEWNNLYKVAMLKDSVIDFRGLLFDVYFASGRIEQCSLDFFDSVSGLSTDTVGYKDVTLSKANHDYTITKLVRVYEPEIDSIEFSYYSTDPTVDPISATKISDKEFSVSFNSLNEIFYYGEYSFIKFTGANSSIAVLSFDVNSTFELNIGTNSGVVYMDYNYNNYVDIYKLNVTVNVSDFNIKIDDRNLVYDATENKFIAEKVTSEDFSSLSSSFGELVGLYQINDEIKPENNILRTNNNNPVFIKYNNYPQIVAGFRSNIFVYFVTLDISTIPLPITSFLFEGNEYNVSNPYSVVTVSAKINENNIIDFVNLNGYVVKAVTNTTVWLSGNNTSTSVYYEVSFFDQEYYFYVYESQSSDVILQTIVVRLNSGSYVSKFIVETNISSYDLNTMESLSLGSNEIITNIIFEMFDGYTYRFYHNGELTTIEDFAINIGDETNEIVISTIDSNNNIIGYTKYSIKYTCVFGSLEYSETADNYSSDKYLNLDKLNYTSKDYLYFNFNETNIGLGANYIIKVNGVTYGFNTQIPMKNDLNIVVVYIYADNMIKSMMSYHIYKTTGVNVTDDYIDIYSQYGVYIDGSCIFNDITISDETYYLYDSEFNLNSLSIKNNATGEVLNATYTLEGNYVIMKWTHIDAETSEEVQMFNIMKLSYTGTVNDENVNIQLYYIDENDNYIYVDLYSESPVNVPVTNSQGFVVMLANENESIVVTGLEYLSGYIFIDGTVGSTIPVTITVTSSDNSVTHTYSFSVTIIKDGK